MSGLMPVYTRTPSSCALRRPNIQNLPSVMHVLTSVSLPHLTN